MSKLYRIGLDIGIGSVGWAVLENDPVTEEPIKILKLGVRTFNPNEVAKTGESIAKSRREKRGLHRRTRRRVFRLERLKNLLSKKFEINVEDELQKLTKEDVYELRAKALDEKLTYAEIAKVVLNIAKRRGFKSNRKSGAPGEDGVLLKSIKDNAEFLEKEGYRTVGEALFKDSRFKVESCGKLIYNIRNHGGDYRNCFHRDDLVKEMSLILKSQQSFGNTQISDDFVEKVLEIFAKQRNFDEGPGEPSPYSAKFEIGKCTFLGDKGELRAPKATFTFEYFSALSKINSLKINDRELSIEEKQKLYDYILNNKELKFERVRKLLSVSESETFNLCRYGLKKNKKDETFTESQIIASSETATMVSMEKSYKIKNALKLDSLVENKELINEVALLLTTCKSDVTIDNAIDNNDLLKGLTSEQKESIKSLNFDKVGSLSVKAMEMIIPYLEQGQRYDIACESAGFKHSSFAYSKNKYLKGDFVDERLKDITSNVVKRSVNQTIRIINEIIKEYGSPQFVNIELTRELSKDFSERNKIKKLQEKNFLENEDAKNQLAEDFKLTKVGHHDLITLRLYKEQDCKCMYSGKEIDINRLFEPNYVQVDHILPYSRSMNDSYNNKVLVLTSENQNKRNQTPYEWFGKDEKRWNDFVARVNLLKNREKKRFLLKENFGEEQSKEFIERNLNDTKYMSKFMLNLMQDYLEMTPSKHKKVVRAVNGAITSYLRKFWGINKIREDGDTHHAIDAAVIATVSEGQIQKITKYNQLKERFNRNEKEFKLIDKETGEVISVSDKATFESVGIDIMSKYLPTPYPEFLSELKIRTRVDYDNPFNFTNEEQIELIKLGYDEEEVQYLKPIFVSRMKTVKTTGAIHAETLMSAREYDETKMLVKTVKLSNLNLKEIQEMVSLKDDKYPKYSIENYYRPESDRLLYLKLKECLYENNGSIPENKPFHKPKKDGTDGPVVKTVKVYEKASNCVITPNGAAANDKMFRVDVFEKDKKFYLCPIYMADVYAKKLPNKLVVAGGKDWLTRDDSYNFKFSLYQNDLIRVTNNKDITLKKCFKNEKSKKADEISSKSWFVYYGGLDISTGALVIRNFDNCYESRLGAKTLQNIEKYYVDIMGKVYKAQNEERKGF